MKHGALDCKVENNFVTAVKSDVESTSEIAKQISRIRLKFID